MHGGTVSIARNSHISHHGGESGENDETDATAEVVCGALIRTHPPKSPLFPSSLPPPCWCLSCVETLFLVFCSFVFVPHLEMLRGCSWLCLRYGSW